MKKLCNYIFILISLFMVIPMINVKAESKIEDLITQLNEDEDFLTMNGNAYYNEDEEKIEISYAIKKYESEELYFNYEDSIIEYNVEEINSYEEANDASSHYVYMSLIMSKALELNGFTKDEIKEFFNSEDNSFDYEINGIEIKQNGPSVAFENEEEGSRVEVTPMFFKIDLTRANINSAEDEEFESTQTTIEDLAEGLSDEESGIISYIDDESLVINVSYSYDENYYVEIPCSNDVITYQVEVEDVKDYDEAAKVSSTTLFIEGLLNMALKSNGYTMDQIKEFYEDENNSFDYDINGIEIIEIGEEIKYEDDEYGTIYITPMSIKIDLAKANLKKVYNIIKGDKQTLDLSKDNTLSFEFDIDYDTFINEGKVYVDDKEVDKDSYEVSKGSTIITFNKDYASKLDKGNHKIMVLTNDGGAKAEFTIDNSEKNPNTSDNILTYVAMLLASMVALLEIRYFIKKIKINS